MQLTLNKMKIGRILEETLIGEGQQPRWGVSKIGGIYLEEGVYYVIYGSRLKNSDSGSITGTSNSYWVNYISAFL